MCADKATETGSGRLSPRPFRDAWAVQFRENGLAQALDDRLALLRRRGSDVGVRIVTRFLGRSCTSLHGGPPIIRARVTGTIFCKT